MLLNQDQAADNSPGATHAQEGPWWPCFDGISVLGSEQRETLSNWLLSIALMISELLSASPSLGSPAFLTSSGCGPEELWRAQGQGCAALWRVKAATQQRSHRAGWTPHFCHL